MQKVGIDVIPTGRRADMVASLATPAVKPKAKETPKPKTTSVASGVQALSIQDTPKVKSKNIDVVSEYKKIKRKNAANFVVIGQC